MREILFRGKTRIWNYTDQTYSTLWIEGYLAPVFIVNDKPVLGIYTTEIGQYGMIGVDGVHGTPKLYECNPKTIGQYTGCKDKNGKKIFEGDIMRNPGNIVEFCNDGYCINGDSSLAYWTGYEVIGNIYDNPELVGGMRE